MQVTFLLQDKTPAHLVQMEALLTSKDKAPVYSVHLEHLQMKQDFQLAWIVHLDFIVKLDKTSVLGAQKEIIAQERPIHSPLNALLGHTLMQLD